MRIWQTRFQTLKALDSLPFPQEIVLEKQENSLYHIEERRRKKGAVQIVCTLEGEGAFRYGATIHKLVPGKTFIARIGDPEIAYYYPGHAKKPWLFLWFSFAGSAAEQIVTEMTREYGNVFDLPLDSGFINYLNEYKTQQNSLQILTPTAGAKIVFDALAALGEVIENKVWDFTQTQLVQSAKSIIFSNLDRTLDVALIARKLNVTREHLTRVFHSQTGTTPGQFAIQERMKRAAKMLQDNRFSCKEIAERLGYGSSSSFARAFKSYYSVSPAEYKQKPVSIPSISVYTEKVSDFPRQYNEYAAELLKDARERFEKYDPCGEFGKNHS